MGRVHALSACRGLPVLRVRLRVRQQRQHAHFEADLRQLEPRRRTHQEAGAVRDCEGELQEVPGHQHEGLGADLQERRNFDLTQKNFEDMKKELSK